MHRELRVRLTRNGLVTYAKLSSGLILSLMIPMIVEGFLGEIPSLEHFVAFLVIPADE